ncbi:MAG TPA: ATP-dependent RNA helicase HrpA [Acidimicrobiia bacterium]|nr:ATP-dependent RNA helicase HrpA [Acidimicrobiia bacterium]
MGVSELRRRAETLTITDRRRIEGRLQGAARIGVRSRRESALSAIEADLVDSEARIATRRAAVPATIGYPEELPITDSRDHLLRAILDNQIVIVAGETGSGKSTQLPKLCLELGRGVRGFIGQTQPRRIAARTIAERVAAELGQPVGGVVGYAMRFSDTVAADTLVKVMTDGLLLAEIQADRRLNAYDTIIIDEAHERSLNIDFLLGYLKRLCAQRQDLKVIVTSATIDTERFSAHFDDAPVVEVSGRTYPVEIRHLEAVDGDGTPLDQPDAIGVAVRELAAVGRGDILVFCSGEREIRDAAEVLGDLGLPNTEILPLYARLSSSEQHRVFAPHRGRRIVLATNVAETSLTVPGIRYVVDPGTARVSRYSRRTKVQRLPIEPISRASADQRAGRCGRLGPGICIRLYSEEDYLSRPEFTEPEILRTNLASVMLQMAAAGLGDIESFPFLEAPDSRSIRDGMALLVELGAVEAGSEDLRLTATGRTLARIPADPRIGRMLQAAAESGCLAEVLVIAAGLSIIDPRERPTGEEAKADALHARFAVPGSDLLGWLALWRHVSAKRRSLSSNQFRRLCREEFLNHRRVREWQDIHSQLRRVCAEVGLRSASRDADADMIHRAVLSGLLSQVGRKDPDSHEYRGARGARFAIAPGSVLFKQSPEWVMATDIVETTRLWARGVARVQPEWIEAMASHLVSRSYSEAWWDSARGAAMVHETVSLFGVPLVSDRAVQFGPLDPAAARTIFIRHALVHGEWESPHPFVAHNAATFAEVEDLEARFRAELRREDDEIVAIFDDRIPADVTSSRHFDAWWRKVVGHDPHRLELSVGDVVGPAAAQLDATEFPDEWHHGDVVAPIHYTYDPGSEIDGVVIDVPATGLDRLDPAVFEWHVPGHREELVVSLIRSLPKSIRKKVLPVKDTAAAVLAEPAAGGLLDHVRRQLSRMSGLSILADDFDLERLPPHLKPTFRIVADDGEIVAAGGDLAELRARLRTELRETVATRSHSIEKAGLARWDFGDLPKVIRVPGPHNSVSAYPALDDDGDSVSIRVLATAEEQADAMWFGTRRLLALRAGRVAGLLSPLLDPQSKADLGLGPYPDHSGWVADCLECAADAVLAELGGPVWTQQEFEAVAKRADGALPAAIVDIGRRSLAVFAALRDLQIAANAATGPPFEAAMADIRAQVVRLVYPGFLAAIGPRRVPDVERYLRAMVWRLDRLPERAERDADHMAVVQTLEAEHIRLMDSIRVTAELIEVGWMLQELRVSYFAQPLGTKGSVSAKRIAAALREAELGI